MKTHKMPQPYPYQVPFVSAIHRSLTALGKALVVMATGTGKTFTVAFALQKCIRRPDRNNRILVLAHLNDVLAQLEGEFAKIFPDVPTSRLYNGAGVDHRAHIVYANFASIDGWIEEGAFYPDDFKVVIVDEGHHAKSKSHRDVIDFFRPKYLIGMTATPDRMDGKDIRDIFGKPVVNLSLVDAMAAGYVTPVNYKLMSVDGLDEEIAAIKQEISTGASFTREQIERRIFRRAGDEGFFKLMAELPPTAKAIIFVDSIDRAKLLAGKVEGAKAYHSELAREVRTKLLDNFKKGSIRRLIAVDALNEGVDVPDADVIVFLRSTDSLTIFLQQLGRGLRLAPGKKFVTVYDYVGTVTRLEMLKEFIEMMKRKINDGDTGGEGGGGGPRINCHIRKVDFTFTEELVDILNVLSGVVEKDFYPTLAEASAAAQKLGIKTSPEYLGRKGREGRYKEDPRLHSTPEAFYPDWEDWPTFLGTNPYDTLAEASAAAQKLRIKTSGEYRGANGREGRYKEDPRLHSTPEAFYPDWEDWPTFLGTNPYDTLAEASAAAQKLRIKTSVEYQGKEGREGRYKEDPRLHSAPNAFYPDWEDWETFLGTKPYATLAEASAAAQKLRIKTIGEYQGKEGRPARYKEDPRLHSSPRKFYPDWEDWETFLGTKPYATLAEASAAAQKLRIKTIGEYRGVKGREGRYKEDPRLHPSPQRFYEDWTDWPTFLGTKPYATLAEASAAARELGIKTSVEYMGKNGRPARYKEDPRLPSDPGDFYSDWEDWPVFLGTKKAP